MNVVAPAARACAKHRRSQPRAPSEGAATLRFVPSQQPAFRAYTGADPPRFANEVELECAKLLDFYGVPWEYEPRTFVLERDEDGRVTRRSRPTSTSRSRISTSRSR